VTTAQRRRWLALVAAVCAAIGVVLGSPASVAYPVTAPAPGDPEGGTPTLRSQLEAAASGYIEAKARYDSSKALEAQLAAKMTATKLHLDLLTEQVGQVAALSYRTGRLGTMTALLEAGSPDAFLDRVVRVETLALHDDALLNQLRTTRRELAQQQDRMYAELRVQTDQVNLMEKKKKDAEKALAAAGGGRVAGGYIAPSSPSAKPAPRNPDGSWPRESCIVDDPTTTGCMTPRLLHAYQQTKAAGFNHYVSCFRSGGSGEHPKGRACDWAAAVSGFGGVASGAERDYGNRLASYYLGNADRLGVMYVIWFRQIWMPGLGWRTYNSGGGDPASDHTNHVHLSVY